MSKIHILVGQKGNRGPFKRKTSSGGGGTFVVRGNNTPLIVAGGGEGIKAMLKQHLGCDAPINTTRNAGNNSPLGSGGREGNGGNISDVDSGKRRKKKNPSVCQIHQDSKRTVRLKKNSCN